MKFYLKTRKTVCECGFLKEIVIMKEMTREHNKFFRVIGQSCKNCGLKQKIDSSCLLLKK